MAEEEFLCRAINDYYASVTDELDLKDGAKYTIMQTSPSGWWYAVNDDGEDGWVPSNYLERIEGGTEQTYDDSKADEPPQYDDAAPTEDAASEAPSQATTAQTTVEKSEPPSQPKPKPKPTQPAVAQPIQFNVQDGAPDKPITEWDVDETLGYLKHASSLQARNDFKLTQACRYLTQLATDANICAEILSKGGLDVVFKVMQATAGDVAIQMSCCAAAVVLCANPAAKQYPASLNGIYFISQGIKDNINYRPFVILAFNAVCNFCHDHPQHRSLALETDIVEQVIKGMDHHCGKQEGYRVHSAGCLALRNVAADSKGQGAVGPNGVSVIVKGLEEYRKMREVVEGSMGVLCNLCALAGNGEAFVMQGGLQLLDNIYSDPDSPDHVRLAAASVLHNLAANQDTALLLSADQGIDLLVKILKKAPVDSVLFLNTLKVLAALLFKLPEDNKVGGNKKSDVMGRILQRGIVAALNEAVTYENKELQEMCATLEVVIAQTSPKLAQALADADAPSKLLHPCMNEPTPQTLHCTLAILFHISDAFQNHSSLVENGLFEFLVSEWYKSETTREDTIRIACGVFIKFFSNVRNSVDIANHEEGIQAFITWCKENRPNLSDLCNAIEGALKQLDPMAAQSSHVTQSYKQVPSDEASKPDEKEPEPLPQKAPKTKETKEISQNMKMDNSEEVKPQQVEAQAAEASGKTHNPTAPSEAPDVGSKLYTVAELMKNKKNFPADSREAYLMDNEFEKLFGMVKDDFYKLRPWKQKQLKKSKGLF